MIHYGDITKLSGYEVPIVDVITGGSPCQGLSVAGLRKGLQDERSGLFMEQIRIIKEMREKYVRESGRTDHMGGVRYCIWENVPGALSSGTYTDKEEKVWKGEDFRIVLEEFARIKEPDAVIPRLEKWQNSGCIMGNGWSLAWRIVDAQFHGTPQRRRRIALLCDLDGYTAPDIMFDPQLRGETESSKSDQAVSDSDGCRKPLQSQPCGVSRNFEQSREAREETTRGTEIGINGSIAGTLDANYYKGCGERQGTEREVVLKSVGIDLYNQATTGEVSKTLNSIRSDSDHTPCVIAQNSVAYGFEPGASKRLDPENRMHYELSPTLRHEMGDNQVGTAIVYDANIDHGFETFDDVCETVRAAYGTGGNNQPMVLETEPTMIEMTSTKNTIVTDGTSPTLTARMGTGGNQVNAVCLEASGNSEPIPIEGNGYRESHRGDGYGKPGDPSFTLNSVEQHGVQHEVVSYGLDRASYNQGVNAQFNFSVDEEIIGSQTARGPGAVMTMQAFGQYKKSDTASALKQRDHKDATDLVIDQAEKVTAVDCRNGTENENINGTLQAKKRSGYTMNSNNVLRTESVVRRLTPDECALLQGFPKNWCNIGEWVDSKGKKHKDADSPKYKAYGNSIAVGYANKQSGFWCWLARRICAQYERQVTMASLFDGIGGFPLAFTACGAVPVWASEIEEFPIAVTKYHFPEEGGFVL